MTIQDDDTGVESSSGLYNGGHMPIRASKFLSELPLLHAPAPVPKSCLDRPRRHRAPSRKHSTLPLINSRRRKTRDVAHHDPRVAVPERLYAPLRIPIHDPRDFPRRKARPPLPRDRRQSMDPKRPTEQAAHLPCRFPGLRRRLGRDCLAR